MTVKYDRWQTDTLSFLNLSVAEVSFFSSAYTPHMRGVSMVAKSIEIKRVRVKP